MRTLSLSALALLIPFAPLASPAVAQDAPATAPAAAEPPAVQAAVQAASFALVLDPAAHPGPFTGRVYLVFSTKDATEPRRQMGDWFSKTQVMVLDVKDAAAGAPINLDPGAIGWPVAAKDIPAGEYTVQAVARVSLDSPTAGRGEGDLYSKPMRVKFDRSVPTFVPTRVTLDQTVKARAFKETDRVKLFEMKSPSLSAFLGRERTIRAGVVLPKDWKADGTDTAPTLVWVPGFGGDHHGAAGMSRMLGDDCLIIVPDPSCYRGHSVFADSANNGPWGKALVAELIPAVEAKYRGAKDADHRFVSGMSSGGWSSLWLQVAYPDFFGGVWSHCPDPVDFRDFQQINLYEPGMNLFKDPKGERRPVARNGDTPSLYMDEFVAQEEVMGPGGQIHAFEAVFSPRLADGAPRLIFDRKTGAIDVEVAKLWEPYDIRLKIEREWATLEPKVKGKIHVYAGEKDTFYLNGAAVRLADSLKALGSDAIVEIIPGMPHTVHRPGIKAMLDAIKLKTATKAGKP
jgi:S-formylglutathione hydrolase FrmB